MSKGAWVKVLAATPSDPRTSPRSHKNLEGENQLPQAVLWPPHTVLRHAHMYVCMCAHTPIKQIFKKEGSFELHFLSLSLTIKVLVKLFNFSETHFLTCKMKIKKRALPTFNVYLNIYEVQLWARNYSNCCRYNSEEDTIALVKLAF